MHKMRVNKLHQYCTYNRLSEDELSGSKYIEDVKIKILIRQKCIVIVEEQKTNLILLAVLFHFLCAQHVSDINISIIRSLRLCC